MAAAPPSLREPARPVEGAAPPTSVTHPARPEGRSGAPSRDLANRVVAPDPESTRRERRALRYRARRWGRAVTGLQRVAYCGRVVSDRSSFVTIRRAGADGVAGFTGVQTCGSVWACPVCSAAIRQARAVELERVALAHLEAGGGLAFLTLTLPHSRTDRLDALYAALQGAWKRTQQKTGWRSRKVALGLHAVRAVETTHAERNGWHPHLHLLLFADAPLSPDQLRDLAGYVAAGWGDAVVAEGRPRPSDEHGTRLQLVGAGGGAALAAYLTKVQDGYGGSWSVGAEMTRGDLKSGRRRGVRTPFDLLEPAAAGNARDLALWREYEEATRGRRCLTGLGPLARRYGVDLADDDEQLVEPAGETVAAISPQEYRLLVRYAREAHALDLAETRGAEAVYALVRALWRRRDWDHRRERRHAETTRGAP